LNYGEVNGPISTGDHGTWNHTQFSVPILYVDPRWYLCNSSGVKIAATPITGVTDPGGTALMTDMVITLTTVGADRTITNATTGSTLTFSGTNSGTIVIDTKNYTVTDGGSNAIGSLTRSGSSTTDWFQLLPGVSNAISSNSAFSIAYTKAYI
jgi:phage-related protein